MFSHGLHSSLCSPTEFMEYTESSCCMFSHRLHRFTQNLLAVCSPTDFTDLHRTFLLYVLPRNARNTQNLLAVYSPTEFTEYTEPSCSIFSHGLHRFSQMLLSRGCTCLKCTNPFCCCTSCSVVALETSAPPERTYLCRSVNSVGEYLGRVISAGELPVNLLLAMLAQIGVALREVVVAEPPATVGRQR